MPKRTQRVPDYMTASGWARGLIPSFVINIPWSQLLRYEESATRDLESPRTFTCFARLPAELRNAVLEAALTATTDIVNFSYAFHQLAIMQVCREFYAEGHKAFLKRNTFRFTNIGRIKAIRDAGKTYTHTFFDDPAISD